MKNIQTGIIIFLACAALHAQNGSGNADNIGAGYNRAPSIAALERQAAKSNSEGDYYAAMIYYQRILAADSFHVKALQGAGEAAIRYGAFEVAESCYQTLAGRQLGNEAGQMSLRLAETKFRLGKFAEAQQVYRRFLEAKPSGAGEETLKMAEKGLADCIWADSVAYNTELRSPFAAVSDINTEYSDFAPLAVDDTLYYASYRFPYEKDKNYPKRHLIKVEAANLKSDTLANSLVDFNENNRHTGPLSFNRDRSVMYYTICEFTSTAEIRCDLYMRKRTGRGVWSAPIKLPEPINVATATNTGPSIAYNAKTGKEILYFVSDRTGGKGKRDIWYAEVQSYGFSAPVNLEALNTPEDDITPYYHSPTQMLYFSTNGRRSMGGYDIWSAEETDKGWSEPRHLGIPINSGGDDAYLTLTQDGYNAYLASNRRKSNYSEGAQTLTEGACCFDIFKAELKKPPIKVDLLAKVFDKDTREPINAAYCRFVDMGPIGSKGVAVKTQNDTHPENHLYAYGLEPNHRYKVIITKPGYTPDSTEVSTEGITKTTSIERELFLRHGLDLLAHALDSLTKDTLDGVKFRLTESKPKGTNMEFINKKGEKFHTFLPFDTRYWLVASKANYTTDSVPVSTEDLEKIPFQTLRKELKLRPLVLDKYLPIVLYFDNDEPDKRTLATITKQDYIVSYRKYIQRKDTFIANFTKGLTGERLQRERDSLEVFFERDVRSGWEKLMAFSETLYEMMERGDMIELTLRGFASPRASSTYNMNLTSRRVSSVWNHFDHFDGGIYQKFVKSGQLTIKLEPNGENLAPPGISEKIDDVKNSVYSVPASRERRLEIIGVRVNTIKKL